MRGQSARAGGGFTLAEMMVVIAVIGMLIGTVSIGMGALSKSDLRSSAVAVAGALRLTYERAVASGRAWRLVMDFREHAYWAEVATDDFYLTRQRPGEQVKLMARLTGRSVKQRPAGERSGDDGEDGPRSADELRFRPAGKRAALLGRTAFASVWTPADREPRTEGRVYVHFFPQGFAERAIVVLAAEEDAWSLSVHPLTGRVKLSPGRLDPPRDIRDDAGQAEGER